MKWPLLIAAMLILTAARNAAAQVDPWEFEVYPYRTLGRGMVELETDNAVVANGHSQPDNGTAPGATKSQDYWYNQYELTYGLTDRIEAAAYVNVGLGSGQGLKYAGSKYRLRGRFFDEGVLPVNLGWYIELEWHQLQFDESELELELRPIIEKDIGRFSFVANPKFEKPIFTGPEKNKGFEFGYACGAYYRWMRRISPGVEFYGGIGHIDDSDPIAEQQHYIFPVVWGELPRGIEYSVGPGFGLTPGSDHVLIKINFALERFVGALFGPPAENGWFF
ncbi:MAG: hypothetical protein Q7S58_07920 [Candidatus Binatus sp.]|uniref:hypothetical protein n=1 Tax=Candidatus Binatus sp. TaxID=2811406 RepID=UPI00271725D4|nr:hypothetical protein [Candidatus Binatus sp.]MDO8432321.1 hypothetical protein [Candidatus Binatus sp.]